MEEIKEMYNVLNTTISLAQAEADFRDAIADHCFHVAANIGRTLSYTDEELVTYLSKLAIDGVPSENFKEYLDTNPLELSLQQEKDIPWNTYRHNPDHSRK